MISKEKLYSFNHKTLQFGEEDKSFHKKLVRILKFFTITSGLAVFFSVIFFITLGSPIQLFLNNVSKKYKSSFVEINNQIDSLQVKLHADIFPTDKYYRELLELDSLPTPIRYAGTGGSNPYDTITSFHYKNIISSTLKKVNVLKHQLKIQNESYDYVFKQALLHNQELSDIPAIQPVKPDGNIWISSVFGIRTDPFTHRRKHHHGLDFAGHTNTEIYATADGIVTIVKDSRRGYGKEIVISHSFGYSTRYAHLNEMVVSKGEKVKRGQLIGFMGNTGRSTGTHLHYEVRLNKRPLNPSLYFANDLSVEEYEQITKRNNVEEKNNNGKAQL